MSTPTSLPSAAAAAADSAAAWMSSTAVSVRKRAEIFTKEERGRKERGGERGWGSEGRESNGN